MENRRNINFSAKEISILMNLAMKFRSSIECKKTDKMNNNLKQKAWEQLSNEFNSICGEPFRNAKVLRGKYENQKKRSKRKFADEKSYLRGTGEGPVKPKIFNDIDEKVKDIIGTQMTGFNSEFGGDCKCDNMQIESGHNIFSDSEQLLEEDAKDSEEDNSLSEVTFKQKKTELLQDTSAILTDWSKMTPNKLKTPKSKPLKTILKAASGKVKENVLSNKVTLWATNKAELASQQKEFLEKEHLIRIELMRERHNHQMTLDTKESDQRLLIQNKKAELELEILQLQKEQLNKI